MTVKKLEVLFRVNNLSFIKDLSDVSIGASPDTGSLLIYDGDNWVGIASTALDKSSTLHEALTQGNVSGIGISVGVVTATSGFFSGILTAAQLNYDVVTDIYSTGIVTATKGIQQTGSEGLHVTAGVSTFVGLSSFLNGVNVKAGSATTALIVQGDARITGILTIGTGSVTIDGSEEKVRIGTGVTLTSSGDSDFVGVVTAKGFEVGTAATISNNGNATFAGIVTATSFVGSGANLTGLPAGVTINTNADNRIITGSGTANTLNGESSLTFDGTKLSVSTGATVFTNGNIAAGIVTATSFVGDGSALTGVGASEEDTAVSSTSATTVLSFAKADYRAAFIKLTITQGSNYQSGKSVSYTHLTLPTKRIV